jgi:hypothetical protein
VLTGILNQLEKTKQKSNNDKQFTPTVQQKVLSKMIPQKSRGFELKITENQKLQAPIPLNQEPHTMEMHRAQASSSIYKKPKSYGRVTW